ncbi:Dam family site-specific DNA-(adenine-N6)-methyltransferase, partial [Niallia circulans]|uniref:Dam family site-specific DNA-(adenine-N6)-methyltransferase n=1 Tax=Niallia circulans TaxID=1397 RepID=UPI001560471E
SFLLTSLLYAMDKVANTVGHYDAYRKKMDSIQPIYLRVPSHRENIDNEIYNEDANNLVRKIKADLVYIDTPYNSRQYGDAYHLLENIIEWNKPALEGIAMKMVNREHIKSKYSTQKAPQAFADLIENIDAKYILVSYNNMAQKGNGRSNAKISNEEILEILSKKGTVEVFDRPFKVFTAGKTKIEDHRELLYLCTVKPKIKQNYVQSAINYTGGKYKLLKQILPVFPSEIRYFYDIFAGGANVAININTAKKIIINDIESHVIDLYKYIKKTNYDEILLTINKIIQQYELSDTKNKGYEYYNASSSNGLKDVNKSNYERLRSDYNTGKFSQLDKPIIFYILIVYGFNNQIRFNGSGEFNMPTGKRDFNKKMETKLQSFKNALTSKNIRFENKDFRELIDEITDDQDFVYLDPPYLISTASYNENGGWGVKEEKDLLVKLNELNERNIKFALSNVLIHKGQEKDICLLYKFDAADQLKRDRCGTGCSTF